MVMSVAFINGWTDAPNSVAACVSTGVLPIKKALFISAISDFVGSITVGMLNGKVSERILDLSSYGNDRNLYLISVFSAMLSVFIFAYISRCFGLPTSESHALLAGILGSSVRINDGFKNINMNGWIDTCAGLIISILVGYIFSVLIMKLTRFYAKKYNLLFEFKKIRILSCILSAFLHGAQDSQKFTAIALSILCSNENLFNHFELKVTILTALIISTGILTSGDKIIKTVGDDLVKLNNMQGFSADISGILCILLFTLCGYPLSTTHVKISAIMGAGSVGGKINTKTATELFLSWIITFPVCAVMSYIITRILIK